MTFPRSQRRTGNGEAPQLVPCLGDASELTTCVCWCSSCCRGISPPSRLSPLQRPPPPGRRLRIRCSVRESERVSSAWTGLIHVDYSLYHGMKVKAAPQVVIGDGRVLMGKGKHTGIRPLTAYSDKIFTQWERQRNRRGESPAGFELWVHSDTMCGPRRRRNCRKVGPRGYETEVVALSRVRRQLREGQQLSEHEIRQRVLSNHQEHVSMMLTWVGIDEERRLPRRLQIMSWWKWPIRPRMTGLWRGRVAPHGPCRRPAVRNTAACFVRKSTPDLRPMPTTTCDT